MTCFFAFTDATPQESIDTTKPPSWHTMAAIGVVLTTDPFRESLEVPTLTGSKLLVRIPDPQTLARTLQRDARAPFVAWKKIRAKRRGRAMARLLSAMPAAPCVFLSHNTRSDLVDRITDRYLSHFCSSIVQRPALVGRPEYEISCEPFGRDVFVSRARLVSLAWVVHSLRVFIEKGRQAIGNVPCIFLHDNLPLNREDDIAVVRTLLNAYDPGRVHFMTERKQFSFAPTDNLAAATNACMTGTDGTVLVWGMQNRLPRNFYMTMDREDGSFVRCVDNVDPAS